MNHKMSLAETRQALQSAVELELSTIPPYLTALFSIKKGANKEAANIIRSVVMEEMLHMVLAGNVLLAINGEVKLTGEKLPSYPLTLNFQGEHFKNREFEIDLAPFSPDTIAAFKQIELPESFVTSPVLTEAAEIDVPGDTIGDFYTGIMKSLEHLCKNGEDRVFTGDPQKQMGLDYFWSGGGTPVVVKNLASALEALGEIVEQGEGTSTSILDGDKHYFSQRREVAHYFRFNEISEKRYYGEKDEPQDPPSGKTLSVDYSQVHPIVVSPKNSCYVEDAFLNHLNEQFNRTYSLMMSQLEQGFNSDSKVIFTAILNGMHRLASIAEEMMSTPIKNDEKNRRGAPSYDWIDPQI